MLAWFHFKPSCMMIRDPETVSVSRTVGMIVPKFRQIYFSFFCLQADLQSLERWNCQYFEVHNCHLHGDYTRTSQLSSAVFQSYAFHLDLGWSDSSTPRGLLRWDPTTLIALLLASSSPNHVVSQSLDHWNTEPPHCVKVSVLREGSYS